MGTGGVAVLPVSPEAWGGEEVERVNEYKITRDKTKATQLKDIRR